MRCAVPGAPQKAAGYPGEESGGAGGLFRRIRAGFGIPFLTAGGRRGTLPAEGRGMAYSGPALADGGTPVPQELAGGSAGGIRIRMGR